MRVDGARDDREPRAIDDLVAGQPIPNGRDAAAGKRDIGAGELPRTDVDETAAKDEAQLWLAMSTMASSGTFAASACLLKASADFTFGTATRTSATSTT